MLLSYWREAVLSRPTTRRSRNTMQVAFKFKVSSVKKLKQCLFRTTKSAKAVLTSLAYM